ncbi:MAG: hypothetical protein AAGC60_21400 [Acidobacteriota bacterium]
MPLPLAEALAWAITLYAAVGLVFAVAFVWRGAARIDPTAADGTIGFRLLILPGAAALWPLLLGRWLRGGGPPTESTPHRRAARALRSASDEETTT